MTTRLLISPGYSLPMTVLSRGATSRRSGRRPSWLLLTALLVLAIGASSTLVFTDRVQLLRLAVLLALWASVVAAFASVSYRREADVDKTRARDLKLVYDLQLDREISARREYELSVESRLRRELASELGVQAADEVAALRTELTALRSRLEILFDTELDQRPALETESAHRGYPDWSEGEGAPADWVSSNRVDSVREQAASNLAADTAIIDVREEPLMPLPWSPQGRHSGFVETSLVETSLVETSLVETSLVETSVAAPAEPEASAEASFEASFDARARHRTADSASDSATPEPVGQSVADLLARLQAEPTAGGRRRRRRA